MATGGDSPRRIEADVTACRACPRLVKWREQIAASPPRRHRGERYWARAVPGFGDSRARLLVVGLAPAAHGGNRTGRIFTGDLSGDWLFHALHKAGFANQPTSAALDDGLRLEGSYVSAIVRCAPPANRPTVHERDNCLPYLGRELELLDRTRVVVALGGFAWAGILALFRHRGLILPRPRPRFAHGAEVELGPYVLLGSYHPSRQNTFTGRLTEEMLDGVFERARELIESE